MVFLLEQGSCPEQISGRLRTKGRAWVSHETIYQFIYADQAQGGSLYRFLRRHRKKRRKRLKHKDRRGRIKDQTSIDQRPAIVDQKARVGDWEIDTVFGRGRKGALVTTVERKNQDDMDRLCEGCQGRPGRRGPRSGPVAVPGFGALAHLGQGQRVRSAQVHCRGFWCTVLLDSSLQLPARRSQ